MVRDTPLSHVECFRERRWLRPRPMVLPKLLFVPSELAQCCAKRSWPVAKLSVSEAMSDGRGSSAAQGMIVMACERCSLSMSRWAPCYSLQPTARACPVPLLARRRRSRVPRRRPGCLCVVTRFEGTHQQVLLPPLAPAVAGRREAGLEAVAARPRLRRPTAALARSARARFRMRRMLSAGL